MFYILWGGEGVPCPALSIVVDPFIALYGRVCETSCLLVLSV